MSNLKKIWIALLCAISFAVSAQNYTVSGYITDKETGEPLIASTVYNKTTSKGGVSNNYGYYSLTLPKGKITLLYSYLGYKAEESSFELKRDTVINVRLSLNNTLQEVTVIGNRSETGVKGTQMSAIEVPINQIKSVPTLFGENDLIKAIQLLPGVQAGTEGSAGLYVRGGGPDENLLLLDGVPLYNVNHMFGFFSVFNSDALKNVTLYKGSFPARFGGRLSSVVDVHMKDGDDKKIKGSASIGLISSKIQVEGPIIKEKTTFNISARRTYIDILAKSILKIYSKNQNGNENGNAGYYFYDLNAKFTHKISDRDKLFLSAYMGSDEVYARLKTLETHTGSEKEKHWTDMKWGWGNFITALRWNHVVSPRLFINTSVSYTQYGSNLNFGEETEFTNTFDNEERKTNNKTNVTYNSGINDWSVRTDFDYSPTPSHDIKFGANYTYHTFSPDVSSIKLSSTGFVNSQAVDTIIGSPKVYAHETMSYIEDNISLGEIVKVNAGLHFSSFHVQDKSYFSLQPRLGMRFLINDKFSAKLGYAYVNQYIHLLSNNSISLPTDLWVPTTKKIIPMESHQYSAGLFYSLFNIADFSIEGYYKTMNNLLEYKDGATFMGVSTNWEDKVSMGKGVAYGIELLAQRSFGKTTGWIGYTWAHANRKFDKPGNIINEGKVFPAKYDRRHDFTTTIAHKFSDRFDIAASWVFSTGNTATFAYRENFILPAPHEQQRLHENSIPSIESRNNFRYNSYHRLDLSVNFHKVTKRGNLRTWNISVYNAYNQLNPFFVTVDTKSDYNPGSQTLTSRKRLLQYSLFPIIPSVTYSLKF